MNTHSYLSILTALMIVYYVRHDLPAAIHLVKKALVQIRRATLVQRKVLIATACSASCALLAIPAIFHVTNLLT